MKLPPELALLSESVATVNEITPSRHRPTPTRSAPAPSRALMMITTPQNPAINPIIPSGDMRFPTKTHPATPTRSGIEEAMMAASEASILCMATKLRPR